MKRTVLIFLFFGFGLSAQESEKIYYSFDANYFYGTIIEHNPDLAHLITGHPEGFILGLSQKTFGNKAWERRYNYPDVGFSFTYQNLKNRHLGENYGLYGHMNFYLLKRNLMFRIGQGLAYASNPYHPERNFFNKAYGSRLLSSTYLIVNYKKENIFEGFGLQGGISLIHYSNADFKSPNASTNTFSLNFGLNYAIGADSLPEFVPDSVGSYAEPLHYNVVLRSGVNTIGVVGSKKYPFLTISAFADKVVSHKSSLQLGTELFFSEAMKERINYESVAFPSGDTHGDEDSKRVGIFAGHQLSFNKLSLVTQLGYYLYYPYEYYVGRIYNRIGLRHKITGQFWGSVTVRSHWANAEAVEFSVGYRL